MPKMHVSKSTVIDAPADKIFGTITDYHQWKAWSPWLIQEPQAKVDVAADARHYSWEGQHIGSGNMTLTGQEKNESANMDLNFLKPWKSSAKVRFDLNPQDGATEVTWQMDSSLPFFLFWMKKMMVAFIGMDFDRGLAMLKNYVEDGEVHSKLDFKGESTYPGCTYIGIRTACTMDDIGKSMGNDLSKLSHYLEDKRDIVAGEPFSIYHKWQVARNNIEYTSGVPVKEVPTDLPAGIFSGSIPQSKVFTVRHTGPYHLLGNAWGALYSRQRSKFFRVNKKVHPFEVYKNMPGEVPDKDLVAEIHFPII